MEHALKLARSCRGSVSRRSLACTPLVLPSAAAAARAPVPLALATHHLRCYSSFASGGGSSRVTPAGLRHMEGVANSHPRDPAAQLMYLSALHEFGMTAEVLRRVESGRFAVEASILELYARALGSARGMSEGDVRALGARLVRAFRTHGDAHSYSVHPTHITSVAYGAGSASGGMSGPTPLREDSYFGSAAASSPSSFFSSTSSSSGGATAGLSGAGLDAGTRSNPLVVEVFTGKRDWVTLLLRAALWGGVAYVLYLTLNRSMPGSLAQLTGDITEEVTEIPTTRFGDVKGVDEAKHELEEVVAFLRDPEKYRRLGAKVPRGVLLTGPPGTGKTLLARAVAGEAGCKFYSKSASEFEEMLVGLGAKRVRDLFASAKKNAPAIIFIDEIDALGGKRRVSVGTNSERQTLNQLLSCMDGFTKNENVIVIAATNAADILDPALTRPGRFDSKVDVPLPDINGRREIIDLYLTKIIVTPDVDTDLLARATPGFSGAQIEAMINAAALIAANRGADQVELEDVEEARDKIIMGPARTSRVKKLEEMRMTAYHEAGHTLVALLTKGAQPLHKVTILPRGMSGGATYSLQKDDSNLNKTEILANIDVAMGGRAAEELLYGKDAVTTGAGMDMIQATDRARDFCMVLSMSELGLSSYARVEPSPERKAAIDAAVESILQASYARVLHLLTTRRAELDRLAAALLENETLSAEECRDVIAGKPLLATRSKLSILRAAAKTNAATPAAADPPSSTTADKKGKVQRIPVKDGGVIAATAAPASVAPAAASGSEEKSAAKKWV